MSIAGSEWSFASFEMRPEHVSKYGTLGVAHKDSLHVLSKTGKYFKVVLSEKGGELPTDQEEQLLEW